MMKWFCAAFFLLLSAAPAWSGPDLLLDVTLDPTSRQFSARAELAPRERQFTFWLHESLRVTSAVVASPLPTGFGMPTLTYLGADVLRLPFIRKTSLGHEILHNWWGNGVYVDYTRGNWSEGLTTLMADYAYKEDESAAAASRLPPILRQWIAATDQCRERTGGGCCGQPAGRTLFREDGDMDSASNRGFRLIADYILAITRKGKLP